MSKSENEVLTQNTSSLGGAVLSAQPDAALQLQRGIPKTIIAAFFLVIAVGAGIYFSHDGRLESSLYADISSASAGLLKTSGRGEEKDQEINDGFDETFGLIIFRRNVESVGNLLSQCESRPQIALSIFRRSMKDGSKDAKLIALYSVFFLTHKNVLEPADIELVSSRLDGAKETDVDIRKAAQRTLSDLILIKTVTDKALYITLPKEIAKSEGEWPSNRVDTLEEIHNGVPQLRIRWSNPDTAAAWWKEHGAKGKWSASDHAWVLP